MVSVKTFREIEMAEGRFAVEATAIDGRIFWYTGNATGGTLRLDQMFRLMDKLVARPTLDLAYWTEAAI